MPLHVSGTRAYRQEVKIVLYSLWYHHAYRWPSRAQVERGLQLPVACGAKLVWILYSFWYIIAVIQMLRVLHVFGVKPCPSHDAKCMGC